MSQMIVGSADYNKVTTFIRCNLVVFVSLVLFLALPAFVNQYYVKVAAIGLLYAYLASSWNIVGGYAGQMSLGHAVFFGIGAYSVGVLSVNAVAPAIFGIPLGILISGLVSVVLAFACFRFQLRGVYFAVGTLLVAEIFRLTAVSLEPLGRSQGLSLARSPSIWAWSFESPVPIFYIALALVVAVILGTRKLERSRFGFALITLREQEESAQALGVDVDQAKRRAFILSAVLTSIGGSVHAALVGYVAPSFDFSLNLSLIMVMGALLGGRGTVLGPIIGGVLVVLVQEFLNFAASLSGTTSIAVASQVVYGAFFVIVILAFPHGIVGTIRRWRMDRAATRDAAGAH